ncbi:MAG: gamma carbonic anhydrase family protein [Desulfobacterales bacterium]|nr:gamma carbonic anhydrase family protein [Desulfobacterales bacterium]
MKSFEGIEPLLEKGVFIAPGAVVLGKVKIGKDSSVFYHSVVRGDVNSITVGSQTNIQDNCTLHVSGTCSLKVGNGVTVGHNAIVHACSVEDNVLIGIGAIVLDGAIIAKDSIVAAGSLVPPGKTYPPGSMIMGSPAKVTRKLTTEEKENIKKTAQGYIKLKNKYLDDFNER